ncbi:MAG: PqiC family protein [Limisphaerales bacterium]
MKFPRVRSRPGCLTVSLLLAAILTVLNGCSFLKPTVARQHLYLLAAQTPQPETAPAPTQGCIVRILPVEVARYLQTRDMVIRTGTNELFLAKFHEWAEPVAAGVRRVLVETLQGSHGIKEVLTDQPSPTGAKVYNVSVQVSACEATDFNGDGSIVFEAAWEISPSGAPSSPAARGFFRAPARSWHPGDYTGLARQLSGAVADFGRSLNQAISAQAHGRAVQP